MAKNEQQIEEPFVRHCDWTGEDRPGKHYVLTTTEGTELVHESAFPRDVAAQLDRMGSDLARLRKRVTELEGDPREGAAAARKGRRAAAGVPAQRDGA